MCLLFSSFGIQRLKADGVLLVEQFHNEVSTVCGIDFLPSHEVH